jgi:hypothetical protein
MKTSDRNKLHNSVTSFYSTVYNMACTPKVQCNMRSFIKFNNNMQFVLATQF